MFTTIIFLLTLAANGTNGAKTPEPAAVQNAAEVKIDCTYLVRPRQPMVLIEGDQSC